MSEPEVTYAEWLAALDVVVRQFQLANQALRAQVERQQLDLVLLDKRVTLQYGSLLEAKAEMLTLIEAVNHLLDKLEHERRAPGQACRPKITQEDSHAITTGAR